MVPDWLNLATRAESRYRDGEARLPDDPDQRQRQLTRMGNAANAVGLSYLMLGDESAAAEWFARAAPEISRAFARRYLRIFYASSASVNWRDPL